MSYGRFDESRDSNGNRDYIQVTKPRPGTTLITMDRPDRMTSMAFEQVIPLHAALEEVAHDNEARNGALGANLSEHLVSVVQKMRLAIPIPH